MADDLRPEEIKLILSAYDDLLIQSMLFDMDIDYENASLIPKLVDDTPFWLKKWRDKNREQDYDPIIDNR